jgi:hypothetical protein
MNEDKLILYYYRDGLSNRERQAITDAIARDPDVARAYEALCRELGELDVDSPATPPSHMVQRWHDSIDLAADASNPRPARTFFHTGSFIWGSVVTAVLVLGIAIGVLISGNGTGVAPDALMTDSPAATPAGPQAITRGLQVHLRETGRDLSNLQSADASSRALLIRSMIDQNRLYERAAEINGAPGLARLLRAFDLVLQQLAAENISPEEAAALQTKLLFEMNAMLTKLASDSSNEPETI